jgi:hypothetical protein
MNQRTASDAEEQRARNILARHEDDGTGHCTFHLQEHNRLIAIKDCKTRQWALKVVGAPPHQTRVCEG